MKVKILIIQLLLLFPFLVHAEGDILRYRVLLNDKGGISAMNDQSPALSTKALERRSRRNIQTDSTDYPLCHRYLNEIETLDFKVISMSRWMNSVVVSATDSSLLDVLRRKPFVKLVQLVWVNPDSSVRTSKISKPRKLKLSSDSLGIYGYSDYQINMLGLKPLHEAGYKGLGMRIAVIDAGFMGVDTLSWFKDAKLIVNKDFIYPPSSVFTGNYHGTCVLSEMAAHKDYSFSGTAPEAEYCLLRSEDVNSEFPIEEDYWVAAVEFADSIGADIITSSIGYTQFDSVSMSYDKSQVDGKTAFLSQAASMAVQKGLLVVCSAGNEGYHAWGKIGFPADVPGVLTVGSVDRNLKRSNFSSVGPTADGRIKPDVMALGTNVNLIYYEGSIVYGSGTSFSAPLITGMAACLWQTLPDLSAPELIEAIKNGSSRATAPDNLFGYGIPNASRIWLEHQKFLIYNR